MSSATSVAHSSDTLPGAAMRSARNSAVRSCTSSASATKAWSIATRGHAAVAGHGLRPAGEARDTGEPCLLREVGGQLQVRVQARLQPPVGLEQEAAADDGRACSTGPGPAASRRPPTSSRDGTLPCVPEPWRRPADQRRIGRARRSVARQGADGATLRDRGREGTPGAVTLDRLAYDAVANHEQDGVRGPGARHPRPSPVHQGQHRIGREGERVGKARGGGPLARCGVPPARRQVPRSMPETPAGPRRDPGLTPAAAWTARSSQLALRTGAIGHEALHAGPACAAPLIAAVAAIVPDAGARASIPGDRPCAARSRPVDPLDGPCDASYGSAAREPRGSQVVIRLPPPSR